jgi:hypothetical protein
LNFDFFFFFIRFTRRLGYSYRIMHSLGGTVRIIIVGCSETGHDDPQLAQWL